MKSSIFQLAVFLLINAYKCNAQIINMAEAIDACSRSWFPRDLEFNEQCLLDGCPALKDFSLCPNTMTNDQLKQFTSIIGGCMAKPVCGITMEPRPYPPMTFSVDSLIPGTRVSAHGVLILETSRLEKMSNIQMELSPTQEQQPAVKLTLPDLRALADFEMRLTISNALLGPLVPDVNITLRKVSADIHLPFTATLTFKRGTTANETNFETQIANSTIKANYQLSGLILPTLFPKLESLLENNAETAIEDSNFANDAGTFYQRLLRVALKTVSKCN